MTQVKRGVIKGAAAAEKEVKGREAQNFYSQHTR